MDGPTTATPTPKPNRTPAAASRTNRSRVSNGRQLFLDGSVDQRSVAARRFRDVLSQLVSDLGGNPSEAQAIICRRAATLVVWSEQAEAELASGKAFDIVNFATATNTLRRLLADLGLERRVLDVTGRLVDNEAGNEAGAVVSKAELRDIARMIVLAQRLGERGAAMTEGTPKRRKRRKPAAEPDPAAPPAEPDYEMRDGPGPRGGVQVFYRGLEVFHAATAAHAEAFISQHRRSP